MGLRDLELPTAEITVSDTGSFRVRGLSLADMSSLVNKHGKIIGVLFDKIRDEMVQRSEVTAADVQYYAKMLFDEAPDVVANAIALAADEPDMGEKVKGLRFTVQLIALEQVILLTFANEAELKKLVEIVTQWLGKINSEAEKLRNLPSLVGSGESEGK